MSDRFTAEQTDLGLGLASIAAWREEDSVMIGVAEHWSGEPADAKISLTAAQAKDFAGWLMAAVGQGARE